MAKRSTGEAHSGDSIAPNPAYKLNISNALNDYPDHQTRSSLRNYTGEYVDNQLQSPDENIYTAVRIQPSNDNTSKDKKKKSKEIEKCLVYKIFLYIGVILSLLTAILALVIASVALVRGFTSNPREQGIQILKSKLNSLVNEVSSLEESWNTTIQTLQAKVRETQAQINESFMLEIQTLEMKFNKYIQKMHSQLIDNSNLTTQSKLIRIIHDIQFMLV